MLKNYFPAKIAADERLTSLGSQCQSGFAGISLRPGNLTEDEGKGTVKLGKTGAKGAVRRGDVARVARVLLENERVGSCWLDLLEGQEKIEDAVGRCIVKQVDCADGGNVEDMASHQQY